MARTINYGKSYLTRIRDIMKHKCGTKRPYDYASLIFWEVNHEAANFEPSLKLYAVWLA